jgi:3-hydroxybutyryl-CoA dehydrogenase
VTADAARAGAAADLLVECVPEDPELKGRVLGQFNQLCPPRAVFATNTSTLLPSMYAEATGRPDRFAALHFHLPVWSANVADVMPHPGTSDETTELLVEFARRLGQIPIRMHRESIGYVFNAVYTAMNRAAITLVANDVASVEDVDRACMAIMKMPVGPFGALDAVGIDTAWHITEYWAGVTGDAQLRANADWLRGRGLLPVSRPRLRGSRLRQGRVSRDTLAAGDGSRNSIGRGCTTWCVSGWGRGEDSRTQADRRRFTE